MLKTSLIDEKTRKYREIIDQIVIEVKDSTIDEYDEPFKGWFNKNNVLLKDIENLRKDGKNISKISAFILESQYLEFKLIDLLQELELLVGTDPMIVNFQGKNRSKELYELTLGGLYEELKKYNAGFLMTITVLVAKLNKIRIRFVHYLFTSIKGIDEVTKEAEEGLAHNDKVVEELVHILAYIKKNTWYGQMYERKRVDEFSKK